MSDAPRAIEIELFSSAFCGSCHATRAVLATAASLVPGLRIREHDVAAEPEYCEQFGIDRTPTVIVRTAAGVEVLRATGAPSLDQVLVAVARAVDASSAPVASPSARIIR